MKSIKEYVTFNFSKSPPTDYNGSFHLVSGEQSKHYNGVEYLTLQFNGSGQELVFVIKYQFEGGTFQDIEITDTVIAIGHGFDFYLYDYINFKSLTTMKMDGYFSKILYDNNYFYVADFDKVYKLDTSGNILWTSEPSLAHDGVILDEVVGKELNGSGCFEPENAKWYDFTLDTDTGELIKGGDPYPLGKKSKNKPDNASKQWWKFWQ
jgi:hypothetical protein